jgi:hypothetical protein
MAEINTYDVGDRIRVSAVFKNDAGAETDPDTVTLLLKRGAAGTETSHVYGSDPDVIRDSAGRFHYDLTIAASDAARPDRCLFYRWKGTGSGVQQAGERWVKIRASNFASP